MSGTSKNISSPALELYIGGFGSFPPAIIPAARAGDGDHRNPAPGSDPTAADGDGVVALARSLAMLSLQNSSGLGVGARGFRPFR